MKNIFSYFILSIILISTSLNTASSNDMLMDPMPAAKEAPILK